MAKQENNPKKYFRIPAKIFAVSCIVLALVLVSSFCIGYKLAADKIIAAVATIKPVREHNQDYQFIYPLLLYNFNDAHKYLENRDLEKKIQDYIKTQYQDKNATSISVEVRDFSGGRWAGVNQDVQYHPGSMMKVIIMMGYFRSAELDPTIMGTTFAYTKDIDDQNNAVPFTSKTNLTVGQSYTLSYLLQDMIANSDNGAETLLLDHANPAVLNKVYADLGISSPDSVPDYTISADQYTDFLRILYNSTYLTDQYSEQALQIMSQSTYKDGLVAGVPDGITVAHKYGERVDSSGSGIQAIELSDCGIVYSVSHTYSICVMTKKDTDSSHAAGDQQALAKVIKGASSVVYNYTVGGQ